jgi:AAA family ATP:ADP antiporter
MEKRPFFWLLTRFVDVREQEAVTSFFMFFYFFLITTTTYIIKPIKISLFLDWLSFENLPFAYLSTALLIGFVVTLNSRLLHTMNRKLYISLSLTFFIINLLLFWWLFRFEWAWLSLVFWFWADIFTATSVTQFWLLVNDIYNPRQAKRLVGFLVSGGLLGGVAGALLASRLAQTLGTENLLLICPFLLALCMILVNSSHEFREQEEKRKKSRDQIQKAGYMSGFRSLVKNRHLLFLSGIMASAIIVTTFIDFQFNNVIQKTFLIKDERTSFLGTFFTVLLVFSYFLHVLMTNRILKNFGMQIALLITPVVLLIGSFALFFVPVGGLIYWAVSTKGADKSLSHSLSQSVRELLYIPLSPEIKYKAKIFIDMFVNKMAKGIGALLLLLVYSTLHFSIRQISFLVIMFIFLWIGFNWMIIKEYVGIVKKNLQLKWQDAGKLVSERIDVDMTKLVFDTIQSRNRSSILYAMNLFDLIKSEKLSPELKKIISSKSSEVRASSMDSLFDLDGEALLPAVDDSLEEEDLSAQVKEIMSLDVYQELMHQQIERIVGTEGKTAEISKMEAAKVLGMMKPDPSLIPLLKRLLREKSPEVVKYALESAGKMGRRELIPFIIPHTKEPATGRIARQALVNYGAKILGILRDYMADKEEDIKIRKVIPDVLFCIGTKRSADLMAKELKKSEGGLESELIEALYKLRTKEPDIQFSYQDIEQEVLALVKKSYLILSEIHDLMSDKKRVNLVSDLENSLTKSLKHIFDLLSLIYPREDILKAYQNISSGTKKAIDYSVELLDNILRRELKEFIIPLIDDIPFDDKVKKCKKLLKTLEKTESP